MTVGTYHITLHVTHHVTPLPLIHHMTYQHVTLGTYNPVILGREHMTYQGNGHQQSHLTRRALDTRLTH